MIRRRTVFDALEPTPQPRWYVERTMHGRVLKSRLLPPGTHLQREFVASIIEHIDGGWIVGEFSSRSAYYIASKPTERIQVEITPSDPNEPLKPIYGVGRAAT